MTREEVWLRVEQARNPKRPTAKYYISRLMEDFIELHGDRAFGDDGAVIGGIGMFRGTPVTVIGQEKGSTIEEKRERNFGCAHPEGYRKALRLMEQAEKFRRPVICLVDTQGAYCGIGAEERGMGAALAENLEKISVLKTPVISVIIGEGGSGGALALAAGDRVAMLENSIYSVLSPEGFASILWKDASKAKDAAVHMKLTAREICDMGIVDEVIREFGGGAHLVPEKSAEAVGDWLERQIKELSQKDSKTLLAERYARYRKFGGCTQQ
ncbi:MAG: acetyl-CoA carboxylase carboxyl transferase subunit alpha [Clostridiales bacterium]|nr:MAG: acetyl-CoA carboxylase carboxyl transferase subunit alpha [Clostridiales bacterium]